MNSNTIYGISISISYMDMSIQLVHVPKRVAMKREALIRVIGLESL